VLCSGGSRGALELGFYRALVELGVPIDFIVGSSVGALNGAFIAAGESPERMNALWRSIRFRDLFGLNWRVLVSPRREDSIYGSLRLRHFVDHYLPAKRFEDLRVPLSILATDQDQVNSADLVIFHAEGATSALDSSAMSESREVGATGVFDPRVDGRLLHFNYDNKEFVDSETGSHWNVVGQATSGLLRGKNLRPIVHGDYFAFAWFAFRPDTEIFGG